MFGTVHIDNKAWVTPTARLVIEDSGYTISQVINPRRQEGDPFPLLGETWEQGDAKVAPIRLNGFSVLWVVMVSGNKDPLVMAPSDLNRRSDLFALFK